jgi:HlyD family secretion protein
MRLSNPGLLQELADAEAELESALADEDLRQHNAKGELLRLENDLASSEASFQEAYFKAESSRMLNTEDAVSELELIRDVNQEDAARRRLEIAKQLVADYPDRKAAEDAQAESRLKRERRKLERLHERVRDLEVRAGIDGVVQVVAVEAGKRLSSGTEVARIVNPHHLIARVSISERDEPLVELGQPVRLDLGRVSIAGVVSRKDPVVTDRYVTVDINLVGESERQLTPDVSVTARIQIERVENTLVVDKPSNLPDGQGRVELFRLNESSNQAELVSVAIGRVSVQEIEVLSGLEPGDRILQSDMSDWLEEPVIRIH